MRCTSQSPGVDATLVTLDRRLADAARELDERCPKHGGEVQPGDAWPAQYEQATAYCEQDEGRMHQHREVREQAVVHVTQPNGLSLFSGGGLENLRQNAQPHTMMKAV